MSGGGNPLARGIRNNALPHVEPFLMADGDEGERESLPGGGTSRLLQVYV